MDSASPKEPKKLKGMHAFAPVRPARTWYYYLMWSVQLLASPILFPFRLVVMLFSFLLTSTFLRLLIYKLDLSKALNPFRRSLIRLQTMLVTRIFIWSTGCRIVEKDIQNKPDAEVDHVIIYNHTSSLDGAVLAALGFTSHISKASIKKMPVFGLVEMANQAIFVDRNDAASKERTRRGIQERTSLSSVMLGLPREWPMLAGAPEGTTTNGTCLIKFKPGFFLPGKPVHVCHLKYDRRLLDISDAHQGMVSAILKMMLCFRTTCTVHYLPGYVPTPAEIADPILYTANVRYYFHIQSGLPLLEMTATDKQYYRRQLNDINKCSQLVRDNYAACRFGSGHYLLAE